MICFLFPSYLQSVLQRKWQCPSCHGRNDSNEPQHCEIGESLRKRKGKSTEESEMGPSEFQSQKVLLSIERAKGPSSNESFCTADSSLIMRAVSVQKNSPDDKSCPSYEVTDLDDARPDPKDFTSSTEKKYDPGCPEDSIITLNSDKSNEYPKEDCRTPLITFSRRAKRKLGCTGESTSRNSQSEKKPCSSSATLRSDAVEFSHKYEGLSLACSFQNRLASASASAVVLQEQTEVCF